MTFLQDKYKRSDIRLSELTYIIIHDFDIYLRTVVGQNPNTATKTMKTFKTITILGRKMGVIHHDPFLNHRFHLELVNRGFLTDEEILKIANKNLGIQRAVFAGLAKNGKGIMGWCHGFKLHLLCNDSGEVITFCLAGAKVLYGKVFADRGYIKQELFKSLFGQGIQLVHGLKARMKNKVMPMWDKIMRRKDISSSASMNCLRTKRTLYTHDTDRYIILL